MKACTLASTRRDLVEVGLGQLGGGDLAVDQQAAGLARGEAQRVEAGGHVCILGTRKQSSLTAGALRSASSRDRLGRGLSGRTHVGDAEHVGGGLDGGQVELADLVDVVEDLGKLGGHAVGLGGLEAQPGQAGDVTDIVFADHQRVLLTHPARAGLQSYHRRLNVRAAWDAAAADGKGTAPPARSRRGRGAAWIGVWSESADRHDLGGLQALVALGDLELDGLTLVQGLVAVDLDLREVDEQVFTFFALDEAVPLLVAEPFDCSSGQRVPSCYLPRYAVRHPPGSP